MSRFDYPDPGMDPLYCNGLESDDDFENDDEEPHCAECGCGLYTDNHAIDCSYGDEEEADDDDI